jgi:transposase InsO family protein
MSRTADCYDNAAMESFASLASRVNALISSHFRHERKKGGSTFEYIEGFYNRTRRHSTLQYLSPLMYEQMMG